MSPEPKDHAMTPICFLDTETTSLGPDRRAWEMAMVRRDDKGEREITLFLDVDLANADPKSLEIGQFYERHPLGMFLSGRIERRPEVWSRPGSIRTATGTTLRQGPPGPDELPRVYSSNWAAEVAARWTHGAHIVGAVPHFDTDVLRRLLSSKWLTPSWHYHLIDVEALAVGYLAGLGFDDLAMPWESDDLTRRLGLEVTYADRHTALGDARWAQRIYDRVMGLDNPTTRPYDAIVRVGGSV